MKKESWVLMRLVILIMLVFFLMPAFANENEEVDVQDLSYRERIFVGGYLGLQIGSYTFVEVSPIVGYRLTNRVDAGFGSTYQYSRGFLQDSGTHTFGGSGFARFSIIPQAFLHAEYELLNLETPPALNDQEDDRIWEENYFLGAGYRVPVGENAFFNLMVLYNFNQDSHVYFQNPVYRLSVEIGL